MAINAKITSKVQGYIPKDLKRRMERVAKHAPYYSISMQTYLALDARIATMEDKVGLRECR